MMLPGTAYLKIGVAVAIAGGLAVSHLTVYNYGKKVERTRQLERSVEVLRDRLEVDDAIVNMDDRALCIELGGLPDECASIGM